MSVVSVVSAASVVSVVSAVSVVCVVFTGAHWRSLACTGVRWERSSSLTDLLEGLLKERIALELLVNDLDVLVMQRK